MLTSVDNYRKIVYNYLLEVNMLDKKAFRILDIIISMTTEGESAVIEKSEIIAKYGEDIDLLDLDGIIEMLALNDMISIRYSDDKMYCITPRPKGRVAFEKRQQTLSQQINDQKSDAVVADVMADENGIEIPKSVINLKKLAIRMMFSSYFPVMFNNVL